MSDPWYAIVFLWYYLCREIRLLMMFFAFVFDDVEMELKGRRFLSPLATSVKYERKTKENIREKHEKEQQSSSECRRRP